MTRYYYKKRFISKRIVARFFGCLLFLLGMGVLAYTFFPLLSWQIYFAPVLAQSSILTPIPKTIALNGMTIQSLIQNNSILQNFDSDDAKSWFPNVTLPKGSPKIPSYFLSIPKLHIQNAIVSTMDYDIGKHIVDYGGTAIPPSLGNAVLLGHSTLPQLFNPTNYHTIFANVYQLTIGDDFFVTIDSVSYRYKIDSIRVVDPEDTSGFVQQYDNSYVTIITCTPPGTTWKRLVIQAALQKIS